MNICSCFHGKDRNKEEEFETVSRNADQEERAANILSDDVNTTTLTEAVFFPQRLSAAADPSVKCFSSALYMLAWVCPLTSVNLWCGDERMKPSHVVFRLQGQGLCMSKRPPRPGRFSLAWVVKMNLQGQKEGQEDRYSGVHSALTLKVADTILSDASWLSRQPRKVLVMFGLFSRGCPWGLWLRLKLALSEASFKTFWIKNCGVLEIGIKCSIGLWALFTQTLIISWCEQVGEVWKQQFNAWCSASSDCSQLAFFFFFFFSLSIWSLANEKHAQLSRGEEIDLGQALWGLVTVQSLRNVLVCKFRVIFLLHCSKIRPPQECKLFNVQPRIHVTLKHRQRLMPTQKASVVWLSKC